MSYTHTHGFVPPGGPSRYTTPPRYQKCPVLQRSLSMPAVMFNVELARLVRTDLQEADTPVPHRSTTWDAGRAPVPHKSSSKRRHKKKSDRTQSPPTLTECLVKFDDMDTNIHTSKVGWVPKLGVEAKIPATIYAARRGLA